MTRRRQTHTQFAINYAKVKASLEASEGEKVAAFRAERALARPDDGAPTKQERHRAQSTIHHQQGAL